MHVVGVEHGQEFFGINLTDTLDAVIKHLAASTPDARELQAIARSQDGRDPNRDQRNNGSQSRRDYEVGQIDQEKYPASAYPYAQMHSY
jgi:hypothetical protein